MPLPSGSIHGYQEGTFKPGSGLPRAACHRLAEVTPLSGVDRSARLRMNIVRLIRNPGAEGSVSDLLLRTRSLARLLDSSAEDADATGDISPGVFDALRHSRLLTAPFPDRYGGEDLLEPERAVDLSVVLRTLGGADLSIARLFEGHVNAIALICRYGREEQIAATAAVVALGGLCGVWGADDAQGLKGTEVDGGWILTGRKILASGAGLVAMPLVTVTGPSGQVLCRLDLRAGERAETASWTAQGMRSSATGSVELSGLSVPTEQVIGRPGDFMRQPHFSGGAWRFCAVHLGAAERLVDLFRTHLVTRGRDGDPFQKQRIAHCVAATTTARYYVEDVASRLADDIDEADSIVALANLTRMVTERAALTVLEAVQRGAGLQAFIRPNPLERIARDLSTYLRQPVPDLAMANAADFVLASSAATGDLWSARNAG